MRDHGNSRAARNPQFASTARSGLSDSDNLPIPTFRLVSFDNPKRYSPRTMATRRSDTA